MLPSFFMCFQLKPGTILRPDLFALDLGETSLLIEQPWKSMPTKSSYEPVTAPFSDSSLAMKNQVMKFSASDSKRIWMPGTVPFKSALFKLPRSSRAAFS